VEHDKFPPVVAGFDGFVDTILHAVSERRSSTEYSSLTTLKAFSERIVREEHTDVLYRRTRLLVNWGIVFSMTEMMKAFLHQVGDHLSGPRKPFFIEPLILLRDPRKIFCALSANSE
jgi:hypothetical protein